MTYYHTYAIISNIGNFTKYIYSPLFPKRNKLTTKQVYFSRESSRETHNASSGIPRRLVAQLPQTGRKVVIMEIKFTEVIQRAIVCMNDRILNAPSEENRPSWDGFSNRWFNSIHATQERIVGNDTATEVVRRTVTFRHNNVVVARIVLEGVYSLRMNGRRASQFACWDTYRFEYALRYDLATGTSDWTLRRSITHNGATVDVKMQ